MSKDVRIGEMIEKYMRRNNLTMKELATKIGKSESSVSLWISGKSMPRMGAIQQMADIFGLTTDQMIFGDDNISFTTFIKYEDIVNIDNNKKISDQTLNVLIKLLPILLKLNNEGIDKLFDFANDLTEIEKYKKQDD